MMLHDNVLHYGVIDCAVDMKLVSNVKHLFFYFFIVYIRAVPF